MSASQLKMSALPPKADMCGALADVCFGPIADSCTAANRSFVARIVSHARKLGMQLGVGIVTDEDRKFAKLLQSPKGILDWIGMPNFLAAQPNL